MAKKPKLTYYRLDFQNCSLLYDYTIVPDLKDIPDCISEVECDLDSDRDAQVIISGVQMTERQYDNFVKRVEP